MYRAVYHVPRRSGHIVMVSYKALSRMTVELSIFRLRTTDGNRELDQCRNFCHLSLSFTLVHHFTSEVHPQTLPQHMSGNRRGLHGGEPPNFKSFQFDLTLIAGIHSTIDDTTGSML